MRSVLSIFIMTLLLTAVPSMKAQAIDYGPYEQTLQHYVNSEGLVDYKALKDNMSTFNSFIDQLEKADVSQLDTVAAKTFWINAYNAITLKVVTDAYPVRGIRWINFGLVWEIPRKVAGTRHSLGHIEHDILRPMGDPRIHFAINCASIGCPKLPDVPFYPKTLDERLDEETRRFINDPEKVRLDKEKGILYLSSIFKWFDEDFLEVSPSLKDYVIPYIEKDDDAQYLKENDVKVKFLDYDWGLNDQFND